MYTEVYGYEHIGELYIAGSCELTTVGTSRTSIIYRAIDLFQQGFVAMNT